MKYSFVPLDENGQPHSATSLQPQTLPPAQYDLADETSSVGSLPVSTHASTAYLARDEHTSVVPQLNETRALTPMTTDFLTRSPSAGSLEHQLYDLQSTQHTQPQFIFDASAFGSPLMGQGGRSSLHSANASTDRSAHMATAVHTPAQELEGACGAMSVSSHAATLSRSATPASAQAGHPILAPATEAVELDGFTDDAEELSLVGDTTVPAEDHTSCSLPLTPELDSEVGAEALSRSATPAPAEAPATDSLPTPRHEPGCAEVLSRSATPALAEAYDCGSNTPTLTNELGCTEGFSCTDTPALVEAPATDSLPTLTHELGCAEALPRSATPVLVEAPADSSPQSLAANELVDTAHAAEHRPTPARLFDIRRFMSVTPPTSPPTAPASPSPSM